jgi:cobalamin biosynthesis protein CobW
MYKIPTTIITGFLGSGKTTLIRNLLLNSKGIKIALIINEFGDLGIDGGLLKGCDLEICQDEDIIELNNGCICCTVADDFIPTMQKLINRTDSFDHIIIETSGLALPQPLVQAFNWPEIKTRVTVDAVITVIDCEAVALGRFAHDEAAVMAQRLSNDNLDHDNPLHELFEDQINAADLIILNKADLVNNTQMQKVRASVSNASHRVIKMVEAENGNLPIEILLGLKASTENHIDKRQSHHDREHETGVHHDHDHDDFTSFVVELGTIVDINAFVEGLKTVMLNSGVLRIKGFVSVENKPMRMVLQAVGSRVENYFDRPWNAGETRITKIVVIGHHDLDQANLTKAISNSVA